MSHTEISETTRIRRLTALFTLAVILLARTFSWATEQTFTLAGLNVTEWTSNNAPPGPHPIIIYSHGFHGCATTSRFLSEALASAGYVVFAPNHGDADCSGDAASKGPAWFVPADASQPWSDSNYRDRADNIRELIAALHSDPRFSSGIDWSRLGLMGHSLGGYTVLGLAGAWPSWKLEGVRAVLALAPVTRPFLPQKTLGGLGAPVMYQAGTADLRITPWIEKDGGAYDQSPAPKLLVVFQNATHFAWTNVGRAMHEQIIAYTVDFMNAYVKGEVPDPILTHPMPGVAKLESDLK